MIQQCDQLYNSNPPTKGIDKRFKLGLISIGPVTASLLLRWDSEHDT